MSKWLFANGQIRIRRHLDWSGHTIDFIFILACLFVCFKDEELARKAEESFDEAWGIINSSDGWKIEKQTPEGDIVHSKYVRRNHKIFRITVRCCACFDLSVLALRSSSIVNSFSFFFFFSSSF